MSKAYVTERKPVQTKDLPGPVYKKKPVKTAVVKEQLLGPMEKKPPGDEDFNGKHEEYYVSRNPIKPFLRGLADSIGKKV